MTRFKLNPDDNINISGTHKTFLVSAEYKMSQPGINNFQKSEAPLTAIELIGGRVELALPVSQRQLLTIADTASSEKECETIKGLCADDTFRSSVLDVSEISLL